MTRTLIKRQIRTAFGTRADQLAHGLWVVRLRAPFDTAQFRSAASAQLRASAGAELLLALTRAAGRLAG